MEGTPHTLIFSDIHLTTAEPRDPARPLWKRYKHRDLFVDDAIARMLREARRQAGGPLEVVLNGDVFDFDAVVDQPDDEGILVGWLERLRGLHPTEVKSAWKMARILDDHPLFVDALREVLREGHRVVFVIGNHDIELHWPAVQAELRSRLAVEGGGELRVCAWFYVSNGDTLIEHGNQYDAYCLALDPISPIVRVPPHGEARVRLPFGNYASRYMINGMGLFNPHVESSFIMSFWGYLVFFLRHVLRSQPLLAWTWLWSSVVTFVASLRDGLLPAEKDVLHLEERVEAIARESNATPRVVRALDALKVHPAIFQPWKVMRELWLDRVLLFVLVLFGSFQALATVKVFVGVSFAWWFALLALLFPPFLFYAHGVSSDLAHHERMVRSRLGLVARIAGVRRVVLGHSHEERHTRVDDVELLNPGTWSPAFRDVACTEPVGRRCVVRLRPRPDGSREATLESWSDGRFQVLPFHPPDPMPGASRPLLVPDLGDVRTPGREQAS